MKEIETEREREKVMIKVIVVGHPKRNDKALGGGRGWNKLTEIYSIKKISGK